MWLSRWFYCVLFQLLFAGYVNAAGNGVGDVSEPLPFATQAEAFWVALERGQAEAVYQALLPLTEAYEQDVDFGYLFGVAALKTQRNDLALEALERVVLMAPQHGGAWLDLALVHIHLGDSTTARSLLEHVKRNFSPDQILVQKIKSIERVLANPVAQKKKSSGFRGELSIQSGYYTNINNGLSSLNFSISPIEGTKVPVRADQSLKSISDTGTQLRYAGIAPIEIEIFNRAELAIDVGIRHYNNSTSFNLFDTGLHFSAEKTIDETMRSVISAELQRTDRSSLGALTLASVGLGIERIVTQDCSVGSRFDLEHQLGLGGAQESSHTPWLSMTARCAGVFGGSVLGLIRAGQERKGSVHTEKKELGVGFERRWGLDWTMNAAMLAGKYRDSTLFSPLLLDQGARWVERKIARLGVERRLGVVFGGNMYVNTYYLKISDKSNIVFFDQRSEAVTFGLRHIH